MPALCAALGLIGCAEPAVLTAPVREPSMQLVDKEQAPNPVVSTPTGAPSFDRAANQSAGESTSLLTAAPDAPEPLDAR